MDEQLSPPPPQQGRPDLDYVTYVPWNLNPDMKTTKNSMDIFLFQMAAQVDAIRRGRALGFDWIAMNDVDEYIVLRDTNRTFQDYLADHLIDDKVPAIQGETITFGNPSGSNSGNKEPAKEMVLDYVWRYMVTFGQHFRTKCIVRPSHVDYYQIHWISGSTTHPRHYAPPDELWMHHYKQPQIGVFQTGMPTKNITMDTTLRDRYSAIVKVNVDDILSRMNI
jgi:Glycosyltransferase family 92